MKYNNVQHKIYIIIYIYNASYIASARNITKTRENLTNAVFWDVTPRSSCKNRRFGGIYGHHYQGEQIGELGTTLAVTSNRSMLRMTIKFGC
jgi:hypothetical protein